jgi:tetratricopeptide (TPR) repeat protein
MFCACLIALAPSCTPIRALIEPAGNGKKANDSGKQAQKQVDDTGKQAQKPIDDTGKQVQKPVDDTIKQAQADVTGGEYKKALELYSSAYEINHAPEMRDNYSATGEQIRKTADMAYQRKDFAEAGNIYNTLIESGIITRDFANSLSFNGDYLNGQKNACSKALLEAGLTIYRDGKLEDAISIWKKAQVFDRDNKDIKSAIETATNQLQNLKNIKQKNALTQ